MNFALIFAGGVGHRMTNSPFPKQFLKVHGKEIIVRTVEHFEYNDNVDSIVVVCRSEYISLMEKLKKKYSLNKITCIVPGGRCGQESIFFGLKKIKELSKSDKDIVLIHDGVRPLINEDLINKNIEMVLENGNAITVAEAYETIMHNENDNLMIINREECFIGKAPQSFYLNDIYDAHLKAIKEEKHDFVDSASLMQYYGVKLNKVVGPLSNIKITTPIDFFILKAILESQESEELQKL